MSEKMGDPLDDNTGTYPSIIRVELIDLVKRSDMNF